MRILIVIICCAPWLRADVSVCPLFSAHGVLQADMPVPVWGTAEPGEEVKVSYLDQQQTTTADSVGKWMVRLAPMKANQSGELRISGNNTIALPDVVTGEVWLCAGQSNMAWALASCTDARQEIAAANHPAIRQYLVPLRVSKKPMDAAQSQWLPCSPATAGKFTGVGYFFARDLQESLKVPVGIINCSKGGSPAQAWVSAGVMDRDPGLAAIRSRWASVEKSFPIKLAAYEKDLTAWKEKDAAARGAGQSGLDPASAPKPPVDPAEDFHGPGALQGGMLHGLIPYAIRGIIWYQGESNVQFASEYEHLLSAMIQDWRQNWAQGDIPFYLVQLPRFGVPENGKTDWAELRDAQRRVLAVPQTEMAVTIDLGDARIHPPDKREFGRRVSLIARNKIYHQNLVCAGPLFESANIEGNTIRISFMAKPATRNNEPMRGFFVAGEDRKFFPADARIDGETIILSSPQVPAPVAARYAWGNNPATANLTDESGQLPASPFRTDRW